MSKSTDRPTSKAAKSASQPSKQAKPPAKTAVTSAAKPAKSSAAAKKPAQKSLAAKVTMKSPAKPVAAKAKSKAPLAKPVAKAAPKAAPKAAAKPTVKAKPVAPKGTKPMAKKALVKPGAKAPAAKAPAAKAAAVKATSVGKKKAAPPAVKATAAKIPAKPAAVTAKAKPAPIVAKSASAPLKPSAVFAKAAQAVAAKPIPVNPPVTSKPTIQAKPIAVVHRDVKPTQAPKVVKMTKDTGSANGSASGKHRTVVSPTFTCPFDNEELAQWRKVLMTRRSEISNDIDALEKDAMEAEDGHTTPLHAAERGSDADLQDVSLGLAGEEKDLLWQIDRAIRKIDVKSPLPFGICEYNKEPISKPRLQLIPWTPLSIEGATHMEENHLVVEDLLMDD